MACTFWVLLLATTACRGTESPAEAVKHREEQAEARLIARVNGEPVSLADYEAALDALPAFARRAIRGETAYRRFMSDLIRFELFYQEAARRGLGSDADVQLAVRNALARQLWRSMSDTVAGAEPDEAELNAHIAAHPDRYRTPDAVTIIQLFTRDPGRADRIRRTFELSTTLLAPYMGTPTMDDVAQRFTALAEQTTEEQGTAVVLGPLTPRDADVIVPAQVLERALVTSPGPRLERVDTEDGTYLFMVTQRQSGNPMSIVESQARARQELVEKAQQRQRRALTRDLVQRADVEVLDPAHSGALDKLRQ